MIKNVLKYGIGAALTGMFCCVAPAVLFGLGLAGGVYAISFADWFYTEQGDPSVGAWVLRGLGAALLAFGIYRYNKKENCSLNTPRQRRLNKWLFAILVIALGVGLFYSFEWLTGWYFDAYIVDAQQMELNS